MVAKGERKGYEATFILDIRKLSEPVEALLEQIKSVIKEMGAEITEVKDLGLKPFARCPRKDFIKGQYVSIRCEGDRDFNRILQERIGLNPNVNRVFVEAIEA